MASTVVIYVYISACLQYNPSGGSDSDAGKKQRGGRSTAATGRGRPPARRAAAKRKQSETEEDEETPISSDEDSDVSAVWICECVYHLSDIDWFNWITKTYLFVHITCYFNPGRIYVMA